MPLGTIIAHHPSIRTSRFFSLILNSLILYLRARGVNSYTHARFDSDPMPRAAQLVFFYPAASLSWWRPPMVIRTLNTHRTRHWQGRRCAWLGVVFDHAIQRFTV